MDAAQWPKALVYDFHKGFSRCVGARDFQDLGLINPSDDHGRCDSIAGSDSQSSHSKQDKIKKPKLINKDQEAPLNCPRCNSTNTKFCYYNNYNPTQPRYLCKACRRYWTHGGTLRNVPVGGSSRKKNRPSLLAPAHSQSNNKLFLDLNPKPTTTMSANFLTQVPPLNPTRSFMHENNHDLNMGLYYANDAHHHILPIQPNFQLSASQGSLSSFHFPMSSSQAFHFQDIIKPTLNLCMDGGFGGTTTHDRSNDIMEGAGRTLYPFGDQMKQDSAMSSAENVMDQADGHTRDHHQSNNGVVYWNNNGQYN